MLILLIFFMVTSTYLNLDMVPVVDRADDVANATSAPSQGAETGGTMLLRLSSEGTVHYRGAQFAGDALSAVIRSRLDEQPGIDVVVLPSGGASMQALVTLMEIAADAGATNFRVMRLEARQ